MVQSAASGYTAAAKGYRCLIISAARIVGARSKGNPAYANRFPGSRRQGNRNPVDAIGDDGLVVSSLSNRISGGLAY